MRRPKPQWPRTVAVIEALQISDEEAADALAEHYQMSDVPIGVEEF